MIPFIITSKWRHSNFAQLLYPAGFVSTKTSHFTNSSLIASAVQTTDAVMAGITSKWRHLNFAQLWPQKCEKRKSKKSFDIKF